MGEQSKLEKIEWKRGGGGILERGADERFIKRKVKMM